MPKLGEIVRGNKLGYRNNELRIWLACQDCGKERWVILIRGEPQDVICHACAHKKPEVRARQRQAMLGRKASEETKRKMSENHTGSLANNWKGGRNKDYEGYIHIIIAVDDPYHAMCPKGGSNRNGVLEHRLIMARFLGRLLDKNEIVHHKNGIRDDNRLVNLALVKKGSHSHHTLIEILQKRIRDLEGECSKIKMI